MACVFSEWLGTDRVQMSMLLFGGTLVLLGFGCEYWGGSGPDAGARQLWKALSVFLVSVGTAVTAAGIVFKVSQKRDRFQESLERAGVLFVGDRNAFDEVIGWDKWILETHRCGELIIVGKDQIKWAEDSARALAMVLNRGVGATFIFQGDRCREKLNTFWKKLTEQDSAGNFLKWRQRDQLRLCEAAGGDVNYGYYWNGNSLVVKLYFKVPEKREAPLIVFNVGFASAKFDDADFSVTCLAHVPFSEKKRMLFQAGANMCKIVKDCTPVHLN